MNKQKTLLDLKAQQLEGKVMPCPRCGGETMKAELMHNALSRHADIYICDACGMDEAFRDKDRNVKPLEDWACFHPERGQLDLKSLPCREALPHILNRYVGYLSMLYVRWQDECGCEDFRDYQKVAKEKCSGLVDLRCYPFQAVFETADRRITLDFEREDDNLAITTEDISKQPK